MGGNLDLSRDESYAIHAQRAKILEGNKKKPPETEAVAEKAPSAKAAVVDMEAVAVDTEAAAVRYYAARNFAGAKAA